MAAIFNITCEPMSTCGEYHILIMFLLSRPQCNPNFQCYYDIPGTAWQLALESRNSDIILLILNHHRVVLKPFDLALILYQNDI